MARTVEIASVVELVAGVDVTRLPLAPLDGFLLSRIDAPTSLDDLVSLSGLPREQVRETVARLEALGAVRVAGERGNPVRPQGGDEPASSQAGNAHSQRRLASAQSLPPANTPRVTAERALQSGQVVPDVGSEPTAPEPELRTGPELLAEASDEKVDLPPERCQQVLALYALMESANHYEFLGVARDAARSEIRSAYFALSKNLHPDTMFRRELGSYKAKMERVFKRATEAYDCLSKKRLRAEYDAALVASGRWSEGYVPSEPSPALGTALPKSTTLRPPGPSSAPEERVSRPAPPPEPVRSPPTERGEQVARQVVSARFSRMGLQPIQSKTKPKPAHGSAVPEGSVSGGERRAQVGRDLAESLRGATAVSGQPQGVDALLACAVRAEREGDLSAADEHLRRARVLAPNRGDLVEAHRRVTGLLARDQCAVLEAEAKAHETAQRWDLAAIVWSKVCAAGERDARAAHAVAVALLRGRGDMRQAQRFAQQAVMWAPKMVEYRVTFATVMLNIGLVKGARRELMAARGLDPNHQIVKNLLARIDA